MSPDPARVPHTAISASAGSGKTFQLAHRYIRLLALGVAPPRICALTFTRKAAGEIFDSIVGYLRKAAASDREAARTARVIDRPGTGREEFLRLLRVFVDALPQARIGTLDSFTAGILRAFPLELGLAPTFRLIDDGGAAAAFAHREVLSRIIHPHRTSAAEQNAFLEAFKEATFGREEKGLVRLMESFLGEYRAAYLAGPDPALWTGEARIWPRGLPWARDRDRAKHAEALAKRLAGRGWNPQVLDGLREFAAACAAYDDEQDWNKAFGAALGGRLFAQLPALARGQGEVEYRRKSYPLDREDAGLLHPLAAHVMAVEIGRALRRTAGIHAILDRFEAHYRERMRRTGELTFSDAQHLLAPAGAAGPSRIGGREDDRLHIDFRLNGRLDHWLIDEFQDTSDLQWAVLANLIDEVLQDSEGTRSFFYVGDVKQAIYGWRGGNAALFRQVLDRYPNLEEQPLDVSFRSVPAVIDTVNAVFGRLPDEGLGPGAVARWRGIWRDHEPADHLRQRPGYACLVEPGPAEDGAKAKPEDGWRLAAGIVRDLDPVRRGLEVAVLVRTNAVGDAVANVLRAECPGIRVVLEGEAALRDNAAVEILRSLVQFAAHPGDTMAWRHLQMSPLGPGLVRDRLDRHALPARLLREIHEEGFAGLCARWIDRLRAATPRSPFEDQRLSALLRLAGTFDATGGPDADAFVAQLDGAGVAEAAGRGGVRVLTIHKAKGLGFDAVILPELAGDGFATPGALGLAIARDAARRPQWALLMPRLAVSDRDPALRAQADVLRDDLCFENLCVLYVAMTRARQGLYLIATPPGNAMNAGALLHATLAGTKPAPASFGGVGATVRHAAGRADWFASAIAPEPAPPPAAAPWPADYGRADGRRRPLPRLEPSRHPEIAVPAAGLFRPGAGDTTGLGTMVHALFERVEWAEESRAESFIEAWQRDAGEAGPLADRAAAQFRAALAAPGLRAALARPPGRCRLWREQRFDVVLEEGWVSGVFDRVVVHEDAAGRPVAAEILDFKTSRVETDEELHRRAEGYAGQMRLYRASLARLLGLPPDTVRLRLVFTDPRQVVDVG